MARYFKLVRCAWRLRSVSPSFLPLPIALVFCSTNKDPLADTKPIQYLKARHLTHEHLVQQACSSTVNSATQLLTQTAVAILDTGQLYREAINELMTLLEESHKQYLTKEEQDLYHDLMVATRSRVHDIKKSLKDLESLMEYVEKVVNATAETSYLAGATYVCDALSERLYSTQQQLLLEKDDIAKLETECLKLQQLLIRQTDDAHQSVGKKNPPTKDGVEK